MIEVSLLTGPSGAGNSSARFVYEELGYFVSENVPSVLAEQFLFSLINDNKHGRNKYCIMVNLSEAKYFIDASKRFKDEINFSLILLTAKKEELLKRYVLTRHAHPRAIMKHISLEKAIDEDLKEVNYLRDVATFCIDTTSLSVKSLHTLLHQRLGKKEGEKITTITFMSYGLKNGIPQGLDCSFDVRALPNPYWVEDLKEKTGGDKEVIDYLTSFDITQKLIDHIIGYLSFYIEEMQKEGRSDYLIGISCSGGQHRSTYVANYLANYFKNKYLTSVIHRDTPWLNK